MEKSGEVHAYPLDTKGFAALNQVSPQGVRKRYCETKSYFGTVPRKLANGRLAWPDVQICAESEG